MIWTKILSFLVSGKGFIVKHWKWFVVLLCLAAVSIFFIRKINNLKHEIDSLHTQITNYQTQLTRDRNDIAHLNQVYVDSSKRQEEIVVRFQQDLNSLTENYHKDMEQLRQDSSQVRVRNTVRYTQEPSEGTVSLSRRLGIPLGN